MTPNAYLPSCVANEGCDCARVTPMGEVDAPGCRLVRITTSNWRVQVRLQCLTHRKVGAALPKRAVKTDVRVLPERRGGITVRAIA